MRPPRTKRPKSPPKNPDSKVCISPRGETQTFFLHIRTQIEYFASFARSRDIPLVTTECWAVVFYNECGLDWAWMKELCAVGVQEAAKTGCWAAIGTSNFCAPQFPGMWDDVAWHRALTDCIHQSRVK